MSKRCASPKLGVALDSPPFVALSSVPHKLLSVLPPVPVVLNARLSVSKRHLRQAILTSSRTLPAALSQSHSLLGVSHVGPDMKSLPRAPAPNPLRPSSFQTPRACGSLWPLPLGSRWPCPSFPVLDYPPSPHLPQAAPPLGLGISCQELSLPCACCFGLRLTALCAFRTSHLSLGSPLMPSETPHRWRTSPLGRAHDRGHVALVFSACLAHAADHDPSGSQTGE